MQASDKKVVGIIAAIGAFLIILVLVATSMYGIYFKTKEDSTTRFVANVLSLPAARVGSKRISYSRFLKTRDAVRSYLNSPAGKADISVMPTAQELDNSIIENLIQQEMVKEVAEDLDVTVSDDDIRAIFADVISAAASSTTPDVAQYLYENYGWNEEDFRQEVLRPALLAQNVAIKMANEAQGDETALDNYLQIRRGQPDVVIYLTLQ
ncbi:SurA N-terminal domain-containing protein [Patescibacteria group bacterium]|nr:SurA N-terminal domain-containing protein [Patescibacteria group bacterium]